MGQRIDFDTLFFLSLKEVQLGALAALIALAPRHPGVERLQCVLKGLGLTQAAAGIRAVNMKTGIRVT